MVSIIVIAVLVVAVGFLLYWVIKSMITPKKIEGIKKMLKQGKNVAAERLAKAIIAKDPRDFLAHYYLGKAYLADNKSELALMEFKLVNQSAIFGPDLPELEFRQQISKLYMKFNQPQDALKEYLLLTKLEPRNSDNFYFVGKLYEQQNRADMSMGFYQKAIQLNRRNVKAHSAMGILLFRSKDYIDAKKEIELTIQMSPDTFSSYYYLGKIYKENKDYQAALSSFEKATRDPEFRQRALIERGSCYMAGEAIDNAIVEFDHAVKCSKDEGSSETLFARYFLAACYEKARKIDLAIEQWEKIYAKNHSFRDVSAKLTEYKDLQSNDSLKEYLTCSSDEFVEICKKAALAVYSLAATTAESTKYGCKIVATEKKNDNWMNVRQQLYLVEFFRETDPIEDEVIRKILDDVKRHNCTKALVFASSGFTRSAMNLAENRPIELIGKDQLEQVLDKAGV
ncbi:MAG: tetratricopeptide repeat protein [Treponema sp.]|nr:tetratricopeptide repeat protein [Treponema sp.]